MKKIIRVTKTGIAKGRPGMVQCCPIARAAKAAGCKGARVNGSTIRFRRKDMSYYAVLPDCARDFVLAFDTGAKVKPFTFTVEFTR